MRGFRSEFSYITEKLGIKKYFILTYEFLLDILMTFKVILNQKKDVSVKRKYPIHVNSIEDTLDLIIKNRTNISRFGDGEFLLISNRGVGYQFADPKMCEEMRTICCNPEKCSNVIVCMPGFFNSEKIYTLYHRLYFQKLMVNNRERWYSMLNADYYYGNADITRCYIELKDKSNSIRYFNKWKEVWNNKNLVIIEGEKSRLGVGTDLFDNTNKISRIIAPSINAYSSIDEIYHYVICSISSDNLIVMALGPTASILACRFAKVGYWAIDIGSIDKEYEWMKSGTKKKTRNPIKYSGEVKGGTIVEECTDSKYLKEIIMRIGC